MKHFQKTNIGKVATDMFFVQSIWSLWYLSFLLVIHFIVLVVSAKTGSPQEGFMVFSQSSSKVYMLVIGIISAYAFINFYVKKGVTRKEYFFGTALGAIGVSIILTILAVIFTGIQHVIINILPFSPVIDNAPFLGIYTNYFSIIIVYMMTILTYYLVGWLIGVGYYRYGWVIGFGFIAIGIIFVSLVEFLWAFDATFILDIKGPGRLLSIPADILLSIVSNIESMPMYISIIGNTLLFGAALWIIRMVTKKVVVKMN